jgi:ATP-dependent helicase Lhr and Lhr-like helicase
VSVFARFAPRLQEAIVARLGWSSLRQVQELAGEALLDGRNAVILAPMAVGKTEAIGDTCRWSPIFEA